jgi:deazaflavin-dependent oxidoreductase (nitroreductase family)
MRCPRRPGDARRRRRGLSPRGRSAAVPRSRASETGSTAIPAWVPYFNVIARRLIALGLPPGPDVLLTVRGRRSGKPRSTPVTLCEHGGRRGFISPFGETHWVRNLRAAGRATISVGRRSEEVAVSELGPAAAAGFIRDVIAPQARSSWLAEWFVRSVDRIDIDHPEEAARGKPVFEIETNS